MSSFWTIILISLALSNPSEAKHQKRLPSAVIVGTVHCDTCFHTDFTKSSHLIAGASVAVECKDTSTRPSFRQEVVTDQHGEFRVHLPFSVSKHVKKIEACSVRLISSNEPYCAVAGSATSSSLHLKSRKDGTHIFSAGFFTFKPLKQPQVCDQKPSVSSAERLSPISDPNDPSFPPPIRDPPSDSPTIGGNLPPLPRLPPLPPLPRMPALPGTPLLPPGPKQEIASKASKLSDNAVYLPESFPFPPTSPSNPLRPPPSVIPFFPPPTSPPPFFHLPPAPGSIPSPLPPNPIPVPRLSFQPTPGFPGVTPAKVSSKSRTSSP